MKKKSATSSKSKTKVLAPEQVDELLHEAGSKPTENAEVDIDDIHPVEADEEELEESDEVEEYEDDESEDDEF